MMKQIATYVCIAIFMISTTFASKKKDFEVVELDDVVQTILLTELTPEISQQIMLGVCPHIAIEYPAGVEIPVKFKMKSDLVTMSLDPNFSFKSEVPLYVRFIRKPDSDRIRLYTSCDLKKWVKTGSPFKKDDVISIKQDQDKKMLVEVMTDS